jgi:hypothetical protein
MYRIPAMLASRYGDLAPSKVNAGPPQPILLALPRARVQGYLKSWHFIRIIRLNGRALLDFLVRSQPSDNLVVLGNTCAGALRLL